MDSRSGKVLSDSCQSLFIELCHSDPQYIETQENKHKFKDPTIEDDINSTDGDILHPVSSTVRVGLHYPTLAVTSNTYNVCGNLSDDTVSIDSENGLESFKTLYKEFLDPSQMSVQSQIDAVKKGYQKISFANEPLIQYKNPPGILCKTRLNRSDDSRVLDDTSHNGSLCDMNNNKSSQSSNISGSNDDTYVSILKVSLEMSADSSNQSIADQTAEVWQH